MTVSITHSWAIGAAVCSARRLQAFTTTEWDMARAEREAQSLVGLNAIGPGLPRHYRTMRIGGRKDWRRHQEGRHHGRCRADRRISRLGALRPALQSPCRVVPNRKVGAVAAFRWGQPETVPKARLPLTPQTSSPALPTCAADGSPG